MKRIFFLSLLIFLISAYLFLFSASSASALTIVKCETSDPNSPSCNLCEAFKMISRGIRIALYIVLPGVAAFAFMLAGVLFLFAGGNEGTVKTGKDIIKVTVYGILIAFGGWIIVNTIMVEMVNPNVFNWWQVWYKVPECAEEGTPKMPEIAQPLLVTIGASNGASKTTADVQKELFGTLGWKEAKEMLNGAGIHILDTAGRTDQPCEELSEKAGTTVTEKCTGLEGIAEQTVKNLYVTKDACGSADFIGGEETTGHKSNTQHGGGNTVDFVKRDTTFFDCLTSHREQLNIKRIGCPTEIYKDKNRSKNCSFEDPGSLHVEYNI